jgi:hypothetical protein
MSDTKTTSSGGIGFCGLLAIVFITLKLGIGNTAVMGWSWWWVLSPLWIPFALVLGILAICFIVWLILQLFK